MGMLPGMTELTSPCCWKWKQCVCLRRATLRCPDRSSRDDGLVGCINVDPNAFANEFVGCPLGEEILCQCWVSVVLATHSRGMIVDALALRSY